VWLSAFCFYGLIAGADNLGVMTAALCAAKVLRKYLQVDAPNAPGEEV
jgi:hypothetical protein